MNSSGLPNVPTEVKKTIFGPPLRPGEVLPPPKRWLKDPAPEDLAALASKVPFVDRADPTVHENHLDFQNQLQYFSFLLASTGLTLQEILERTFEPHEIRLLEAVRLPSLLVDLQKENIIRYSRIVRARFPTQKQSLALKLTLLWFGLPVAPIKPGIHEVEERDIDFGHDSIRIKLDPLAFLDSYSERKYGESDDFRDSETMSHFPQLNATQEFPSMGLRGGADPTSRVWEIDDDDEPAPDPQRQEIRVFGYQGSVLADPNKNLYPAFVEAVDLLLARTDRANYRICLEIWDHTSYDDVSRVETTADTVDHGSGQQAGNDTLHATLLRYFVNDTSGRRYGCFVYFDREEPPSVSLPSYLHERYLVRVWDAGNQALAYMKVPRIIQPTHKPNQFYSEYVHAMRVIFSKIPHSYLQFTTGGQITYGLFDPPPEVWNQVMNEQSQNGALPVLQFTVTRVPDNQVVVWVPGVYTYDNQFSPHSGSTGKVSGMIHRDYLKLTGTETDRRGIQYIYNTVEAANESTTKSPEFCGLEIWLSGQKFLDLRSKPHLVSCDNNGISVHGLLDWRDTLNRFSIMRYNSEGITKMSMVVRPIFQQYRFHASNSPNLVFPTPTLTEEYSLDKFKKAVKTNLFPDYSATQTDHVLHLTQTTWGLNTTDFVIRSDTDDNGWKWILRRLTEPDVTVSLERWTNDWAVEEKTVWGPRYDKLDVTEISSRVEAPWIDKPFSNVVDKIFKSSTNDLDGVNRARMVREKLFWNTPSIFTNPAQPVYPTHAPLLESIIRTGPFVPGYTIAMRTPSEMARLQREVHTLRGNLLDRIRECPFNECQRYFPFRDREGLSRHITEDHSILKCFLCNEKSTLLPYYDQNSLRRHFIEVHRQDISDALNHGGSADDDGGSSDSGGQPVRPKPLGPDPVGSEPMTPQTPRPPPREMEWEESQGEEYHGDLSDSPHARRPSPAWKEATSQDPIPPRREPSPEWDLLLEKSLSEPFTFQPDPDWRCSRCFRAAGRNFYQAEMHMDSNGSCRIRRGLGTASISRLPNRSGWILPSEGVDFAQAFSDFVTKYPAYRHTMFPVRDSEVERVYRGDNNLHRLVGSIKDDPNMHFNSAPTRSLELPWPPYEGTVIPLHETSPANPVGSPTPEPDKLNFRRPPEPADPSAGKLVGMVFDGNKPPLTDYGSTSTTTDITPPTPSTPPDNRTPALTLEEAISLSSTDDEPQPVVPPSAALLQFPTGSSLSDTHPADASNEDLPEMVDYPPLPSATAPPSARTPSGPAPDLEALQASELPPREEEPETGPRPKRRRAAAQKDPTFTQSALDEEETVSEEFSEAGAVPDPVGNLDPNAPRTPRRRPRRSGRKPKPRGGGIRR
ncbi:hypothetical protein F5B19DRAFT_468386 [Rostrohypoxylon terebratum]|nr:hypothetical protein F5B19DRAFT_468386 [Rostrohypoxylon terebratum]